MLRGHHGIALALGVFAAACGDRMSVGDMGGDASVDGNGTSTGAGGATGTGSGGVGGSSAGGRGGSSGTGGLGTAGDSAGGKGPGTGGTGGAGAGAGGNGAAGSGIADSGPDVGPPGAIVCGGETCTAGQDCCFLDGRCFDVADATACPKPPDDNDPWARSTCGMNAHCGPDAFCASGLGALCLGPGHCESRANCGNSTTFVCGCNGVSYPNFETACAAGARVSSGQIGCGPRTSLPDGTPSSPGDVTFCGFDSQCQMGTKCCAITGRCYDPAKAGLCMFPPPGTSIPCVDDTQCNTGFPGETGYCRGPGCSGPGGCVIGGGLCDGELAPVCGCNGKNYMNTKCAGVVSVRVRHDGYCTDAETPDAN